MSTLRCPAKINLYLAILGKDENGYHQLDTVFAKVDSLSDLIHIEPAEALSFHCSTLPAEENSVLKALRVLEEKTQRSFHYKITLEKYIPVRSGLGGAASDAASLLLFLNQKEELRLSQDELMELGAQVGKDVPFFISGFEVARGTRYGDLITPLPSLPKNLHIEIEWTGREVSTPEAFHEWDEKKCASIAKLEPLLKALEEQNSLAILGALHNDFEQLRPTVGPTLDHSLPQVKILAGSGGAYAVVGVVGK